MTESAREPLLVISVVRSGGVAGLRAQWRVELHERDELARWQPLLDACPWDEAPRSPAPDRFVYDIRADDRHAVVGESRVDDGWRELIRRVRESASPSRRVSGSSGSRDRSPS